MGKSSSVNTQSSFTMLLVGAGDSGHSDFLNSSSFNSDNFHDDLSWRIIQAPGVEPARRLQEDDPADLIVLCESVPPSACLEFVEWVRKSDPRSSVAVVAAKASVDWAVRMIRAGACDYLNGPLTDEILRRLVAGIRGEQAACEDDGHFFCDQRPPGVPIVGRSEGITRVLETIRMVAQSRCNPILVLGETGTGKELAAQAVHAWRHGDPRTFVAVNCATLTAGLLESELFGHVKGAFTGADRDKAGLFELASDGTIFLDEISEMDSSLQAKLLRVLQEKSFRKVGGTRDIPCNATIVASSNRDLLVEARQGRFRCDLYYRLAVFPIRLPTLRSQGRREDIPLLAEYFLQTLPQSPVIGNSSLKNGAGGRLKNACTSDHADAQPKRLSSGACRCLADYSWPGNVRELRNVIERATILQSGPEIGEGDLVFDQAFPNKPESSESANPDEFLNDGPGSIKPKEFSNNETESVKPKEFSLEAAEREFIIRALKETNWQRTRAAMLLGITRATLHAKLKRYDIQMPTVVGTGEGGAASADSPDDANEDRRPLTSTMAS